MSTATYQIRYTDDYARELPVWASGFASREDAEAMIPSLAEQQGKNERLFEVIEETTVSHGGVRLVRRIERGPRGGARYIYQAASASRVWGYWYDSASQAASESGEADRVVRL